MHAFVSMAREDPNDQLLLTSIAHRVASLVVTGRKQKQQPNGGITPSAFRRVREFVEASLRDAQATSPTLATLADAAGISIHHFIKAFRTTTGETPYAWVLRRRTERARDMLFQTDQSVADIAFTYGFASPAHFVATFKQHMGITPGAFRNAVVSR